MLESGARPRPADAAVVLVANVLDGDEDRVPARHALRSGRWADLEPPAGQGL